MCSDSSHHTCIRSRDTACIYDILCWFCRLLLRHILEKEGGIYDISYGFCHGTGGVKEQEMQAAVTRNCSTGAAMTAQTVQGSTPRCYEIRCNDVAMTAQKVHSCTESRPADAYRRVAMTTQTVHGSTAASV